VKFLPPEHLLNAGSHGKPSANGRMEDEAHVSAHRLADQPALGTMLIGPLLNAVAHVVPRNGSAALIT
jgi:hypothetical protein